MSRRLSIPCPAKLNLFLHITGRLSSGYHSLQTLFQLLEYGDMLHLKASHQTAIELDTPLDGVAKEQHLAIRAAQILQQTCGVKQGVSIALEKRLPVGGGLGGGSSNAASTLLGLNTLWGLKLSLDELAAIGLELGADVPVFIRGQNSLAEGIGEQLYPVELPNYWYVVLKPSVNVATAAIFSHAELTRDTLPIRIAAFFEGGQREGTHYLEKALANSFSVEAISQRANDTPSLENDCEAVACRVYPEIAAAIDWLNQYARAKMTGTGCCVFARFDTEKEARTVFGQRPNSLQGFVTQSSSSSSAHRALNI